MKASSKIHWILILSYFFAVNGAFVNPNYEKALTRRQSCVISNRFQTFPGPCRVKQTNFQLHDRPQDNLVAGIAEIGFAFSLGVLWSEYSVILTGCGPLNFSDTLERICYQGVIVVAGIALFNRIVTGKSLEYSSEEFFGPLESFTLFQVKVVELTSALAVIGAFIAIGFQLTNGEKMDGLSGIDIEMCRALRDL